MTVKNFEVRNVLANGVKVFDLMVGNDFVKAQEILDISEYTSIIDAECAFSERVENEVTGIYEVTVERVAEYQRFLEMLEGVKQHSQKEKYEHFRKMENLFDRHYYNDTMDWKWHREEMTKLRQWYYADCECTKCSFRKPTFQEWQNNLYVENVWNDYIKDYREKKTGLGKKLKNAGFDQTIIDFYSAQVKTEKTMYLVVSDLVQHIAGMSFFAKANNWNGYGVSTCQDPRNDSDLAQHLAGALHDDKLFIGMLVENKEDIFDMTDKLEARVLFRYIEVDGIANYIPTRIYGNVVTKNTMDKVLTQLNEVGIHEEYIRINGNEKHREEANGGYELSIMDEVNIYEKINESFYVECPVCEGEGKLEKTGYTRKTDKEVTVEVTCPCCGGNGEYEIYVNEWIDEYVEVEEEMEILPYYDLENYYHGGEYIRISVDFEEVRNRHEKYNR